MRSWIGWCALVVVGCGLPEPRWVGEHVELAADQGLEPCGDVVGHMDAYVEQIAAALGVAAPVGDERIPYYWLHMEGFKERTICVHDAACSLLGAVYSIEAPTDHELVHALVYQVGLPPPLFVEGLAVAFEATRPGDFGDTFTVGAGPETIVRILDRGLEWLPPEEYPLAGVFTAFLVRRHGVEALLRVYGRLGLGAGADEVSRIFAREFGETLADASEAFAAEVAAHRDCPLRGHRLKTFECAAPEIGWDGRSLGLYETLSCARDDAVGPFTGEDLVVYRTLVVPADGVFEVAVIGDSRAGSAGRWNRAVVARCGGCEGYTELTLSAEDAARRVVLPAGRYMVQLLGPVRAASGVGLRIERVADVEVAEEDEEAAP